MKNHSNRARILQELVNVEAWHKTIEYDEPKGLHVALSFHDARYSGGDRSPVSFRVQLKRATLVIVCDPNLSVPRGSKVREYPTFNQTVRTLDGSASHRGSEAESEAGIDIAISDSGVPSGKAAAKSRFKDSRKLGATAETERTQVVTQRVRMIYNEIGEEHHWNCEPIEAATLAGPAHNGDEPLIEVKAKIAERLQDLGIRVFLRCKADDFVISEVDVKPSMLRRFTKDEQKYRLKMAKVVLQQKLAEADLEVTDLDPKFQDVVIADILAVPE